MLKIVLLSVTAAFLTSCISFSTLQTPKVLEEDQKQIGLGSTLFIEDGEVAFIPEGFFRIPVAKNVDIGFKISAFTTFGMDLKYQALAIDSSFYVALDVGVSYGFLEDGNTLAFYPAVIMGSEHIYGGAKMIIAQTDWKLFGSDTKSTGSMPVVFAGLAIGNDFRLLPEIDVYFTDDFSDSFILYNLGIDFKF